MANKRTRSPPGQLRIIGGDWRGRRIAVLDRPDLRPTPARIRETLFNWLGPSIAEARCLDLFAGSGALGFEALSRGAGYCEFIDTDSAVIGAITRQLRDLSAGARGRAHVADALQLPPPQEPFDLVFLDPPFRQHWVGPLLQRLIQPGYLGDRALIYVETAGDDSVLSRPPQGLAVYRDKRAGDVRYGLLQVEDPALSNDPTGHL